MGGAIGFTIREESGKEHRMCRWTNNFAWYTDSLKLVEKDPGHLKKYLDGWKTLKDWHKNRKGKTFADCLVPYAGLNPVEYGLIVVDYQKNVILDMNHYHAVGNLCTVSMMNDVVDKGLPSDDSEAGVLGDFFRAKRVKAMGWYDRKKKKHCSIRVRNKSESFFVEKIKDYRRNDRFWNFELDLSPFKVLRFEKSQTAEYRQAVLDLGFKLTKKESKEWDQFQKYYSEPQHQ